MEGEPDAGHANLSRRKLLGGGAAGAAALASGLPVPALARRGRRRHRHADVAIVGAGLSGLVAARDVQRAGKKAIVIEARRRVGGRVLSHSIGGEEVVDLGGTFTGPTQDRIQELAKQTGVKTFPTYNDGDNVFFANGQRQTYSQDTPFGNAPTDPRVAADIALAVTRLDEMAAKVPVDAPYKAENAGVWDSQTLDTWLRDNTTNNRDFRAVVSAAMEAIFGAEARDLSLLYALFYIAASGNESNQGTFERNFNTAGGAQERRFAGGAALMPLRLAEELGRHLILRSPVRRIEQSGRRVKVVSDRAVVRAKRAIVAIPPTLAGRIDYQPLMPANRDALTQRMPQGNLIKVDAVYDEPFWRADGLTGQVVSEDGPIKITFDSSPQGGTPGVMLGFVGGHEARSWQRMSAAKRRTAALESLADYFGPKALQPRDVVIKDWSSDAWNRGCPVSVLPPGVLIEFGPELRAPVGKIHWAGTETSTYWNGYMDGAVRAGERAAAEVLAEL